RQLEYAANKKNFRNNNTVKKFKISYYLLFQVTVITTILTITLKYLYTQLSYKGLSGGGTANESRDLALVDRSSAHLVERSSAKRGNASERECCSSALARTTLL